MLEVQARASFAIDLHGDVGGAITPETVSAALRAARGAAVSISLHSYGGDAMAGVAIHNILARYAGRKTIMVDGVAASAASLIAMAGDRILMPANALIMVHDAWGAALGDAGTMRDQAALLDTVSGAYRRTYAARTGKPEDEIAALMAAETWFSAEEAVAARFADEVIPARPVRALAGAAQALAKFLHPPAALAAHTKETPQMDGITPTPRAAAPVPATLAQVKAIADRAGLPAEWVLDQVEAAATIDVVRDAAIDAVAARAAVPPIRSVVNVLRDEGETLREAEADYVAARLLNKRPSGAGARFAGYGMADMLAEGRLAQRGIRVGRGATAEHIFARLTTDDLPLLLRDGANRAMTELFPTVRSPLLDLCERRSVEDFRPVTLIRIAQHKPLDKVEEGAEVTAAYPYEAGEKITIATYANTHIMTRQVLVNDDTGGLSTWLQSAAQASAARERELLAGLLTAGGGLGPTLSDALPWFDAARGNIGTAGILDATSLADAVAKMRGIKDTEGRIIFGLEPGVLVVSPTREYIARQLVANLAVVTDRSDVQPYNVGVIVEPALSGARWWLAPRPELRRCITAAYLGGAEAPTIETFTQPEVLGVTIRVVFDVAAAVSAPEGWVTNAGAP